MSNTGQPLLEVSTANLTLGKQSLLENINLKIGAGEILTIIGPNGAGKTTLLRIALGLQKPTSGTVKRQPGLTIGYMPQRLHLDPTFPLTVKRFWLLLVKMILPGLYRCCPKLVLHMLLTRPFRLFPGGSCSGFCWLELWCVNLICWFLMSPFKVSMSMAKLNFIS